MNSDSPIDGYISAHPRESLQLLVLTFFLFWQSSVVLVGLATYYVLIHLLRVKWWFVLLVGIVTAMGAVYFQALIFKDFVKEGFAINFHLWRLLLVGDTWRGVVGAYYYGHTYLLGFPLIISGLWGAIDLIPANQHEAAIKGLHQGKHRVEKPVISDKKAQKILDSIQEENLSGTLMGVSMYSRKPVVIADQDLNQIMLVLGTTGGGKTVTLRRFYQRAAQQGYPLIIIDGKPDEKNITWLMALAEQKKRRFYGFNCGNYSHYDCLSNGGYTELKDKIISLKDEWENDYYRSIAEDYLQTTFEALIKVGEKFDLKRVVECLNYEDLAILVREMSNPTLMKRVNGLDSYNRKDITGLQAHLNLLIHSELGEFFETNEATFNLQDAIEQEAVVYFALPALRFPSFSKVLGKLVINDLKAVIDRQTRKKRIFTVFDEFSVFAGEQVLNLVNMGREKGIHAIFGTQGLADLEKIDSTFKDQLMNCANSLICHRLNDQNSAEGVANWVGTKDVFTVTAQLNLQQGSSGLGSVRTNKEFVVHPDAIKQSLQPGEAFYITKVGKFNQDRIKVKFL